VQRAWTSSKLNDGSATGYGYGWMVVNASYPVIQHDGSINGFASADSGCRTRRSSSPF